MTSTEGTLRPTRQRKAVAACLETFDDFRSAQDIHDLLKQNGENVGLSTVYRTLQALAEGGEVDVLRAEDGEALYRRCSTTHHHHLVCRSCGRTVEVGGPDGGALGRRDGAAARLPRRQPHARDLRDVPHLSLTNHYVTPNLDDSKGSFPSSTGGPYLLLLGRVDPKGNNP